MDGIYSFFSSSFSFLLLLLLLQKSTGQQICSVESPVNIRENNKINQVVTTITIEPDVTVAITSGNEDNTFRLEENRLLVNVVLDYEEKTFYTVGITCTKTGEDQQVLPLPLTILVDNENDNPPVFDKKEYSASINEMSAIDTTVGSFPATDLDSPPQLFYSITPATKEFKLKSTSTPEILVSGRLDYDKIKEYRLELQAQDTPLNTPPPELSFTATATIVITILDGDNRPPWFQPCNRYEIGGVVICENSGYTGRVNLNEQETEVLPLKPAPLYAVDGDSGINEEITYSFLSGNEDGLFEINPNSGNITMLKAADVLGTITLSVLASQKINIDQIATTTVTIDVQVKSIHPPKFEKTSYEALVTSVGSMAKDLTNTEEALIILATDDDYTATGGVNPHVVYEVVGSPDFLIFGGYLFMTKQRPEGTLNLQISAVDEQNDETATATLVVEVKTSLFTTSLPLSTTDFMSTTDSMTSEVMPTASTSSMSTEDHLTTTNPTEATATTHQAVIPPSGEYKAGDMAAIGATLGILLFVCLVVIGVLVHRMRKSKTDWKKISEVSTFRSSLGPGGQKEGVQYTNEAFQRDDDNDSFDSGPTSKAAEAPQKAAWNHPNKEAIQRSVAPLSALLPDNSSDLGSDKADDKEVKPILTKERKVEEGYKSVWFKEDIDPDAKEEVVIIPDSREDESDEDEASSSGKEDEEGESPKRKFPKVLFADPDLDSGIGVKVEDPAEDSDSEKEMNIDL